MATQWRWWARKGAVANRTAVPTALRFFISLALVTAAGLVLRVTYVRLAGSTSVSVSGDGAGWFHPGANYLADGKGFVDPIYAIFAGVFQPGADHPPGWTVVLSITSRFGFRSWPAHQVVACSIGSATIVVVGLAGRRLASPRAGLIAAVIAAVYPNFWLYEAPLLSETLVIFVVALTVLLALRFRDSPTMARAVTVGAVCGVVTLVRAEQVLLFGFLLVPLLLVVSGVSWRRRLGWLAAASGAGVLVIAPWIAFNLARYQEPTFLTTNFGGAVSIGNCDQTYYGPHIGFWEPACYRTTSILGPNAPQLVPLAGRHVDASWLDARRRQLGLDYARAHLQDLPAVLLAREGRTWSVFQPFQQMHLDHVAGDIWPIELGFYTYWLLAPLALLGSFVVRQRKTSLLVVGAFVATVTVATAITFGQTRYRAPAEVTVVLLAAVGADSLLTRRRRTHDTTTDRTERRTRGKVSRTWSPAA